MKLKGYSRILLPSILAISLLVASLLPIVLLKNYIALRSEGEEYSEEALREFINTSMQIVATVYAVVISISLVAHQMASELYTIRIHYIYSKDIWIYTLVMIVGILHLSLLLLLPREIGYVPLFAAGLSCLLIMILYSSFYLWRIIKVTVPEKVREEISSELSRILAQWENDAELSSADFLRLSSELSGLVEIAFILAKRSDQKTLEELISSLLQNWVKVVEIEMRGKYEKLAKKSLDRIMKPSEQFKKTFYSICADTMREGLLDMLIAIIDMSIEMIKKIIKEGKEKAKSERGRESFNGILVDTKAPLSVMEDIGLILLELIGFGEQLNARMEIKVLLGELARIISYLNSVTESSRVAFTLRTSQWIESIEELVGLTRLWENDFSKELLRALEYLEREYFKRKIFRS